ncbi:MAG: hypothetical protein CMP59_09045 [Flavobacteriales bacterium]|nr:hypothetical protein [Flavobacteriales bacterium]
MGFNSLRLVGLNPFVYKNQGDSVIAQLELFNRDRSREPFSIEEYQTELLKSLEAVVRIAKEEDLRIMLLLPKPKKLEKENNIRLTFIKEVLKRFSKEPTVFSYDFFNEPLYFDNSEYREYIDKHREKEDAVRLTEEWQELMDELAPKQLITIGLSEPIEAFEWDPSILDLDFVSFHTYHPLRVPNEIYWYANYSKKPWIISETSLPADNDSISYEEQALFMKEALQRTIDCGGAGFGWWQFQDVSWGPFEHDHTAIMDRKGMTYIDGDSILGTVKKAAKTLQNFDFEKRGDCDCHVNYYNMMGYNNYLIEGKLINKESGDPIEGAVIRGWNRYWTVGLNTFSDEEGVFRIYSNDECVNFEISGPGTKTAKFTLKLEYDTVKQGRLKDRLLEYHSIHYQPFVKDAQKGKSVFDFDPKYYGKHKLKAKMETIELEEVDL